MWTVDCITGMECIRNGVGVWIILKCSFCHLACIELQLN